jgi:xanthine dehydrogenase accessory factor
VVATQGRGDRAALEAALKGSSPYIALIASQKKAAKLKSELMEYGLDATKVKAIRAPAGLDIAATTPEEIAVSILAEMIQLRHAEMLPATDAGAQTDDAVVSVEIVAQADCGVEDPG